MFFFRFRDFHSLMMESCFIFNTFFLIFPEWKQNIKIIKTFPVPPQSWSSSGILTYIAPCKCNSQWVLLHFQVSFSRSLVIYSQRENILHEVFFFFFSPFLRRLEAVGGQNQASLIIQSFLAQVEPSYVPCLSLQFPRIQKQVFHDKVPGSYSKCINRCVYCMYT